MKIYRGEREIPQLSTGSPVQVTVEWFDKNDQSHGYSLHHIVLHSPTGMNWGYAGSGPADLALSILVDHYGEPYGTPDKIQLNTGSHPAVLLHQLFKFDFIAKLPQSMNWRITEEQIRVWLQSKKIQKKLKTGSLNYGI